MSIRNRLMQSEAAQWRDPWQFLDMVSNPWIPGNWYNPATQSFNNPLQAFGLDGLGSRIRGIFQPGGQPLPGWMQPGAPQQPQTPQGVDVQVNMPGVQPQGQGPLMRYQSPPQHRPGPGGGRTIAQGESARRMVEGMRDNTRNAQNQARNAMRNMFRDAEL